MTLKLNDLGFATFGSALTQDDLDEAISRGAPNAFGVIPMLALDDLEALGYALLEMVLTSFQPPDERTVELDALKLKRQVEDLFSLDVAGGFREYADAEPALAPAVALLDRGSRAGWRLIEALIKCKLGWKQQEYRVSAAELVEHEWFNAKQEVPPREIGAALEEWAAQAQMEVNQMWNGLPIPEKVDVDACLRGLKWLAGGAGLTISSRLGLNRRAAVPPPPGVDPEACDSLLDSEEEELPEFPEETQKPWDEFSLPVVPLPRLLPSGWQADPSLRGEAPRHGLDALGMGGLGITGGLGGGRVWGRWELGGATSTFRHVRLRARCSRFGSA